MQENGLDTKARIFNASLRLFATDGVENATTRGIANAAGIKSASIYNHYKSKDEILLDCYKYLVDYNANRRLTKDQYLPILQNGAKEDIIHIPNYDILDGKSEKIIYAIMVTVARIHTDARARDIYHAYKNDTLAYLREFFETGIAIGRFAPFDFHPVSLIYLSTKLYVGHSVSADAQNNESLIENHVKMLRLLADFIPFRY